MTIMLKKRAQGMSVRVIIVAVIGLIILVAVIAMLTSKLDIFKKGVGSFGDPTKTCADTDNGGELEELDVVCDKGSLLSSDASSQGKKCCKK